MKHLLHHLRWLLWRFRLALAACVILWTVLTICVWRVPVTPDSWRFFLPAAGVMLLAAMLILVDAIWQDPPSGTDTFWRTRPPRWRAVWGAQVLFGLLLCLPPAGCWLVNGLMMRNTATQWLQAVPDLMIPFGVIFIGAGIASFVRSWRGYALAIVFVACASAGGQELLHRMLRDRPEVWSTPFRANVDGSGVWTSLLILAVLLACWAAGMRRPRAGRRILTLLTALLAAPYAGFLLTPLPHAADRSVDVIASGPEYVPQPGDQPAGSLVLRGVPENNVAALTWARWSLEKSPPGPGDEGRHRGQEWYLNGYFGNPGTVTSLDVTPAAGKVIRGLFPEGTRWYKGEGNANSSGWSLGIPDLTIGHRQGRTSVPPPLWLSGQAGGVFLSAVKQLSIPLTAGTAGADNGCRVRLEHLEYSANALSFTASLWTSLHGSPPGGITLPDFFSERALPVLYLPAVPMAILLTRKSESGSMRSWQCGVRRVSAAVTMPDAEAANGVTFTAETMRGAELVLCAPLVTGLFQVRLPKGPQQFAAEKTAIPDFSEELEKFRAPPAGEVDLKARTEFMRKVLRTPLGYRIDNSADKPVIQWWNWLNDDLVPDFAAAVRRDPAWMQFAWKAKLETKLQPAALELVRSTSRPLPLSVVASAAAVAPPGDYAQLARHVRLVEANPQDLDRLVPHPFPEMWARLRTLPGFDWKRIATDRWLLVSSAKVRLPDFESIIVAEQAALAGNVEALSSKLAGIESQRVPGPYREREPSELYELIEALPPPGGERGSWLEVNLPFLVWEEARGKYLLKN